MSERFCRENGYPQHFLLNNKSTSEVFLIPFLYVNVDTEVGEPTSLAMLKLVTKLQTPSTNVS